MPSLILGPVNINSNSGAVNFGDTLNVSPKSTAKAFSGSGGGNTGNFVVTNNGANATNTLDANVTDQPMTANA
ncbi:spore germination protein [Ammoniphilus sp. CFH 90114]|uniref:spore germination protein n=1 Tax=Ammoniphilus sp. CFH 90114 TaxID=2493665 RepID=UPI00100EBC04|nr:spore germination protein [Ammoniphilus sp. CFH 90114]RXT06290.1 spore germination protein [Ammoniphilus sp. CFH 90114]